MLTVYVWKGGGYERRTGDTSPGGGGRGGEEQNKITLRFSLPEFIVLISCREPSADEKDALKDHTTRKGTNCHVHRSPSDK